MPSSLHPGTTQPILHLHKLALLCSLCNLVLIHPSAETRRPDQPLQQRLILALEGSQAADVWVFPSTCTKPGWVEKMPVCKYSLLLQWLLFGLPWPTGPSVTFISLPKITTGFHGSLGMDQTGRSLSSLEIEKTHYHLCFPSARVQVCGVYLVPLPIWKGLVVGRKSLL